MHAVIYISFSYILKKMQKEANYMIHDTAEASSSCNVVCNIQQQIKERLDAAVLLTRGLPCSQMLIKMD